MSNLEVDAARNTLRSEGKWPSDRDTQQRIEAHHVICARLNTMRTQMQAVENCLPMARALFGVEAEEALRVLNRQFRKVEVAADKYVNTESNTASARSLYYTLFGSPIRGLNDMDNLIEEQIRRIEDKLLPVLRL